MKKIDFEEVLKRADKIKVFDDLVSTNFEKFKALIEIINENIVEKINKGTNFEPITGIHKINGEYVIMTKNAIYKQEKEKEPKSLEKKFEKFTEHRNIKVDYNGFYNRMAQIAKEHHKDLIINAIPSLLPNEIEGAHINRKVCSTIEKIIELIEKSQLT